MNEGMSEWMNEWMNEWIDEFQFKITHRFMALNGSTDSTALVSCHQLFQPAKRMNNNQHLVSHLLPHLCNLHTMENSRKSVVNPSLPPSPSPPHPPPLKLQRQTVQAAPLGIQKPQRDVDDLFESWFDPAGEIPKNR